MTKTLRFIPSLATVLCLCLNTLADVRLKQRVTMSGQKFETTRSIKGARERTEQKIQMDDPAMADFMPQIATITQCDLKRTVQLNDRKQLYFVQPFQTAEEPAVPVRATPQPVNVATRKGGTMTMSYTVRDTGERKMMFGLQARHFVVTQEMETSADSCSGPNRTKMEWDGWYVDFSADFNCPNPPPPPMPQGRAAKPDCIDRIIRKGTGTPPKGIMVEGTMKIFGADGSVQMTQTTETLELSRAPLEAALFDIPHGYRQVSSSQELYAVTMPTMADMDRRQNDRPTAANTGTAPATRLTSKSVSVDISLAGASSVSQGEIDQYVRNRIAARGFRAVSGPGDYSISIQFRQIKESSAGKLGGLFGKVTGVETKAGKVDIDLIAIISGGTSGEARVKNKFDGPPSDAVRSAVDQALNQLLGGIRP